MAHASDAALDVLETLLKELRALGIATERKRGVFYRGTMAFLHFHEYPPPTGIVADLKLGGSFVRFAVNTEADRRRLIAAARRVGYTRAAKPARKQRP